MSACVCVFWSSGERSVINRRQARYILHNVNEVSRVLQAGLGREQQHDIPVLQGVNTADDTTRNRFSSLCRRLTNMYYRHCVQYIPAVLAILVVNVPIVFK